MDRRKKIRLVVIIPTIIVMMIVGGVVYGLLQAGTVATPAADTEFSAMGLNVNMVDAKAEEVREKQMAQEHAQMQEHASPIGEKNISCAFDFLLGLDAQTALDQIIPLGRPYRVFEIGDPVTMDFVEERINLQTGQSGKIEAVTCG